MIDGASLGQKVMHPRFSLRSLFAFTAAIAAGYLVSWRNGSGYADFFLGILTVFVATGLVQQILFPPEADSAGPAPTLSRRLCLCLILTCLALAIFRANCPYVVPNPNVYGDPQDESIKSSVARPLWIFALVLGSLSAPGTTMFHRERKQRRRALHLGFSTVFVVLFLGYVVFLVRNWAFMPMIVDLAIHGMKVGMHQGAAVGTPHYVDWFGRSPEQFNEFLQWQICSWPFLLLALVITICRCQSRAHSLKGTSYAAVLTLALVIPSTINAIWLWWGAARRLSPELVTTYWDEPRVELGMMIWPLLLITLYLTTRRVQVRILESSRDPARVYWSDSRIVGWLFIVIGCVELVESFIGHWAWEYVDFVDSNIILPMLGNFALEIIEYPEYCVSLFLLPYGVYWLWRRQHAASYTTLRWPQFRTRQAFLFPVVLVLLSASIVLCIPFGIALYHVGI